MKERHLGITLLVMIYMFRAKHQPNPDRFHLSKEKKGCGVVAWPYRGPLCKFVYSGVVRPKKRARAKEIFRNEVKS